MEVYKLKLYVKEMFSTTQEQFTMYIITKIVYK